MTKMNVTMCSKFKEKKGKLYLMLFLCISFRNQREKIGFVFLFFENQNQGVGAIVALPSKIEDRGYGGHCCSSCENQRKNAKEIRGRR